MAVLHFRNVFGVLNRYSQNTSHAPAKRDKFWKHISNGLVSAAVAGTRSAAARRRQGQGEEGRRPRSVRAWIWLRARVKTIPSQGSRAFIFVGQIWQTFFFSWLPFCAKIEKKSLTFSNDLEFPAIPTKCTSDFQNKIMWTSRRYVT